MNSKRSGRPFPLLSSIFRAKNRWSARRRCFSGVPAQYLAQDFAKLQRVGSPARSADGHRDFLPAGGLCQPPSAILSCGFTQAIHPFAEFRRAADQTAPAPASVRRRQDSPVSARSADCWQAGRLPVCQLYRSTHTEARIGGVCSFHGCTSLIYQNFFIVG